MAFPAIGSLTGNTATKAQAAAPSSANPFSKVLAAAGKSAAPATLTPQQQYDRSLAELQQTLASLFSSSGIDTSHEIQLEQGSDGKITLANEHPDGDQIDKLLAAHPELQARFTSLSAKLRALKQSQGDPNMPLDVTNSGFLLTLENGQATGSLS